MKLLISATDARRSGVTIGELAIERPTREQGLLEGCAELLANMGNSEALDLYRKGLARDYTRDEVCDEIVSRFGIQFFAKPVTDTEPLPAAVSLQQQPKPAAHVEFPPLIVAPSAPPVTNGHSPRQLLRARWRELRAQRAVLEQQYKTVKKQRDEVKAMEQECRYLLRIPRRMKSLSLVARRRRKVAAEATNAQ
jgi:hypothetical protein